MKKKFLLPFLLTITSLSVSGCSFFNFIIISSSSESIIVDPTEKLELKYTVKELNERSFLSTDVMPSKNNPKLLVLPILFRDSSDFLTDEDKSSIVNDLNKAFFGTKEETGWYSVKSYYEAESYGVCSITGTVNSWYQSNYYYNSIDSSEKSMDVLNEAVADWKAKNPDLIKVYDSDSDGYLDGVIGIYGGPNYSNTDKLGGHPQVKNMWAYTGWSKNSSNVNDPMMKTFIWASYDFMYNDNTNGLLVDGHTYIHEMGHVLGLEDYYDYNSDANSPFDKNFWAGAYSMQDFNVGGHDPYSIISLGWANPYVPTETITYTIRPFESSGDVIMLTPDFTNSAFDEYILIELYTPTGVNERDTKYQYSGRYPVGPTTAGIRIWHVDARLIIPSGPTTDRDGNTYYTRSTISTSIDKTSLYCLGPTNTTYKRGGSNNGYSTLYPELRNYHLLELIRNEDYLHTRYNDEIANSDLFKTGSTFTFNDYSKYFTRTDGGIFSSNKVMNNGKTLGFTVSIDSVNSSRAIVTVTKQ